MLIPLHCAWGIAIKRSDKCSRVARHGPPTNQIGWRTRLFCLSWFRLFSNLLLFFPLPLLGSVLAEMFHYPQSIFLPEKHRCDFWIDVCDILWNLTINIKIFSRSVILGQIPAFSVNLPHGTQFQGPHSYPWEKSPDYLEISKMRTSVRGKRKTDYWLWNTSTRTDPWPNKYLFFFRIRTYKEQKRCAFDLRILNGDTAPTNKICRRASSGQRPRTRPCHESERFNNAHSFVRLKALTSFADNATIARKNQSVPYGYYRLYP